MRGLNLDHLRIFLDVIEFGGFSAAAERHGLTQPAVRPAGAPAGAALRPAAGRARGQARRGHPPAGQNCWPTSAVSTRRWPRPIGPCSRIRPAWAGACGWARGTACAYLLPPLLAGLKQRFPDLDVVVSTGNTADVLRGIEGNALDIGLVTLPAPGRMFEVTPVLDDEFVAIFPPAGLSAIMPRRPARRRPRWPEARALVLFEPARTRRLVDDWSRRPALLPGRRWSWAAPEAMKEIVAAGRSCAVLPGMAVSGEARAPAWLSAAAPAGCAGSWRW